MVTDAFFAKIVSCQVSGNLEQPGLKGSTWWLKPTDKSHHSFEHFRSQVFSGLRVTHSIIQVAEDAEVVTFVKRCDDG